MKQEKAGNFEDQKLKRINSNYISHEIQHLIHFEKGFPFTIKNLLLRPGKSIREFLFENRDKYVKPVLFLVVSSVVFLLLMSFLHIHLSFFNIDTMEILKGKIRSKEIGAWTNKNMGYSQLIMGIFISLWIKVFYRKYKYNIFEILVLLSFVLGEALLIFAFFIIVANIVQSENVAVFGIIVYFVYIIWAIGQFFGEKKAINYIKSFFVYFLGNATYLATLVSIAYLLKFIL
ncbi:hypothetical protein HMPREF0765_4191 [Sphingobacterium spiritivorum ATCC 33300]|uniref:DUF3667 domain-containing protein n=3 Tax=Sphingobacterium spiritivorum TaxID=258 RepID=D7VTJ8_SPHSI|nr:DUF3667 domain-containing protein [Sphingobacterium spiritivorum]EEI90240.1 hypothetical protein HMPREF0765_4191 [Sphingobacterium spiritivorum ATCC 33300]EFK57099.1 hypothetical protein HMPREF0766_14302 [Sphingobacterium spiritivorum ATCC 33861]QQS95128.1 DUF3667 domain-containing protein [Sphingobacterium spiritivorum]QQT34904.1 DUF3667 domain-containing protein [Sphingobacterium spiritivorum]WQD35797.1 DUF3667 domain-containing protein [Sphingobacterium spiritivorum]